MYMLIMDDEELTRLAEEEILKETKRLAERAAVYGALGWMKCPLRPTNKQFLVNTILPTLTTNRKRHHEDREDYYRRDEGMSRGFYSDVRHYTGERYSHHSKRESNNEGRSVHSHKDGKQVHKSNRERHDKIKDCSPAHKGKLSDRSSLDNRSKESRVVHVSENKMVDSRNSSDEHKGSELMHHKNSKDRYSTINKGQKDKYPNRKSDSLHGKKLDDNISSGKYKDKEPREYKTDGAERHKKSRTDDRSLAAIESEHSVGTEFEYYKDKRQKDGYKISDSSSKHKHGECSIKHEKVKAELSCNAENETSLNSKSDGKNEVTVIESKSSNFEDCHKTSKRADQKKRKMAQKRKKDKSKKHERIHVSDTKKFKKKKRKTLATENDNIEASVDIGVNIANKAPYKSEKLKCDVGSDEERKHNIEKDKLKVQQQCEHKENGINYQNNCTYVEQSELESSKGMIIKSEPD